MPESDDPIEKSAQDHADLMTRLRRRFLDRESINETLAERRKILEGLVDDEQKPAADAGGNTEGDGGGTPGPAGED